MITPLVIILGLYILISELVAICLSAQLVRYCVDKKYACKKPVMWYQYTLRELILFATLIWLPVSIILLIRNNW